MNNIQDEIENVDYSLSNLLRFKWIVGSLLLFILTLATYIPLTKSFDNLIYNSLKMIPGCTMSISDYQIEFLLPKIKFNNLTIPKECTKTKDDVLLDKLNLHFNFISFSPFGLSFTAKSKLFNSDVEAKIVPGFTSVSVLLETEDDSRVNVFNLNNFSDLIPMVKLNGNLWASTVYASLSYSGEIEDLSLNLASKDLVFPEQVIQSFRLNRMDLKDFLLQLDLLKNNKIHIKKFIIGHDKSPVISSFSGNLTLNKKSISSSKIDLNGEVKVSENLLNSNFILKGYLQQFDKKDKFYQIHIKGFLNSPKVSSKR